MQDAKDFSHIKDSFFRLPVNRSNFLLTEIPKFSPYSAEYLDFWREEKRRCVEGFWAAGIWMPGTLYAYVNHFKIKLNKTKHSKVKALGRPHLRDVDWERNYVLVEAMGFSRFEHDTDRTCYRPFAEHGYGYLHSLKQEYVTVQEIEDMGGFSVKGPDRPNPNSYRKIKYVPAREYLRSTFAQDMGRPLYENQALNVLDIEGRGGGKSYTMASFIAHNFLFDGATSYEELLDFENRPSSETVVGAIDAKYSKDLLNKVQVMYNNLEGGVEARGVYHPPPFFKRFTGQWNPGKEVIARYQRKVKGQWVWEGTGSSIAHRSFNDNPEAANGTRPNKSFIEEVGLAINLKDVLSHMKECTMDSDHKFGVIWMGGTGGSMDGGATVPLSEIFENPEEYDCVSFPDLFENSGRKIGMFVPASYTMNQYKDENGNTDFEKASQAITRRRERLKRGTDKKPYMSELQYQPLSYTEAFLVSGGNIFPTAELRTQLNYVMSSSDPHVKGVNGEVVINATGKAEFVPDLEGSMTPASYPIRPGEQPQGCVTIWGEIPDPGQLPAYGTYIAATDPYSQDKSSHSVSMGSTLIFKMPTSEIEELSDLIVAEYTGRPERSDMFYEQTRLLCSLFNAPNLYENQFINMRTHFEHHHSLHLLQFTPTQLKATANTKVSRTYGLHMSAPIRDELEVYLKNWLLDAWGEGKRNLHKLISVPLLKELVNYNDRGNFDRVDAFLMLMAHRMFLLKRKAVAKKEEEDWSEVEVGKRPFFERPLFTNPSDAGKSDRAFRRLKRS